MPNQTLTQALTSIADAIRGHYHTYNNPMPLTVAQMAEKIRTTQFCLDNEKIYQMPLETFNRMYNGYWVVTDVWSLIEFIHEHQTVLNGGQSITLPVKLAYLNYNRGLLYHLSDVYEYYQSTSLPYFVIDEEYRYAHDITTLFASEKDPSHYYNLNAEQKPAYEWLLTQVAMHINHENVDVLWSDLLPGVDEMPWSEEEGGY